MPNSGIGDHMCESQLYQDFSCNCLVLLLLIFSFYCAFAITRKESLKFGTSLGDIYSTDIFSLENIFDNCCIRT